jgi:hypothetical protein
MFQNQRTTCYNYFKYLERALVFMKCMDEEPMVIKMVICFLFKNYVNKPWLYIRTSFFDLYKTMVTNLKNRFDNCWGFAPIYNNHPSI